mmetsp:Transcript_101341/g.292006  ORF Transcript_101341/g.292006 Transcript_101341/m.292006 type:complete len:432 (+) Transcript_101341:422-1717(+)
MLDAHMLLFALSLPLGLLLLQLHLNDALELLALELRLLAEAPLLFGLLPLSGDLQLPVHVLLLLFLAALLLPGSPLRGLGSPLGSEGVHLGSLVLRLLLHRAKPRGLFFLLRCETSLLLLELALPQRLVFLVFEDLLLLQFLGKHLVLLDLHRSGIGLINLLHEPLCGEFLLVLLLHFLGFERIDLLEYKGALLISLLLLPHALALAVLDLLDDHLRSAALALESLLLADLVHLQRLQPFDLHHGIELTLLLFLLGLNNALFLHLRIPDCHDLRIQHHLIHMFHVVGILVELLPGVLEDAVLLAARTRLLGSVGHHRILLPFLLHLPDLLLPRGRLLHTLQVSLLLAPFVLGFLLLAQQRSVLTEPIQLRSADDHNILFGRPGAIELLPHLHSVFANDRHFLVAALLLRPISMPAEQSLVDVGIGVSQSAV